MKSLTQLKYNNFNLVCTVDKLSFSPNMEIDSKVVSIEEKIMEKIFSSACFSEKNIGIK